MKSATLHPGRAIRLQRIWKHRRAVIIPYDHGAYSGVVAGLEDPLRLTERIAGSNADAVLVTPGILRTIAPALGGLGVVLRIDGGHTAVDELVLLCDRHHHVVHLPGWVVKFDGFELRVVRPDGVELRPD